MMGGDVLVGWKWVLDFSDCLEVVSGGKVN